MQATSGRAREVCRVHGLQIVDFVVDADGYFVVHARDIEGQEVLVKQTTARSGAGEIAALAVWADTGITPCIREIPQPGLYVADWIAETVMAELPTDAAIDAGSIGRALAQLHGTTSPGEAIDMRASFAWLATSWDALLPALAVLAQDLTEQLLRDEPLSPVLLHGDLVPYNVILTADGPRFIDPTGNWGTPSWDLAKLAVAWEAMGRQQILAALIDGYGAQPPAMAEILTWVTLVYLQKNLPFPQSPLTPHLLPMARELEDAGTPDAWLRRCPR